jgi:predicted amidohydrolase
MVLNVAVAQFAPGRHPDENARRVALLAGEAADSGADLVVLPEYSSYFGSPMDEGFAAHAEPLDGPFTSDAIRVAAERGLTVVFGLVEAAGERFRNTAVAVDGSGVLAVYRKTHLYDAFGARESDWVEAGPLDPPQLFEAGGLRIGLQTCYDLRFPEVTRRIAEAGADLVLMPADWVPGPRKEAHWRTLAAARAIENTVYLAAAGQVPPGGIGSSLIVDPEGEVLAELGELPGVAVAPVDGARVAEVRRVNPALALRRYAVLPR